MILTSCHLIVKKMKREAIERSRDWWYCDNIINHAGQIGLLHMGFPRVFILMRDEDAAYWASFEEWSDDLIEVNFLTPSDREECDDLNALLIDAWNFLALTEEAEEDAYYDALIDEA